MAAALAMVIDAVSCTVWPTGRSKPETAEFLDEICDVDLDALDLELPLGFGRDFHARSRRTPSRTLSGQIGSPARGRRPDGGVRESPVRRRGLPRRGTASPALTRERERSRRMSAARRSLDLLQRER